jgi:UDP-GlcNAc:undecaprenyl-phosphate GlcNAc-1-phosphate transferase
MSPLIVTFLVAFTGSLLLTPVVRLLAKRAGAYDHPDDNRKFHKQPTPLWGGLVVYLAVAMALAAVVFGSFDTSAELVDLSVILLLAAGIVCISGAIDDHWCLSPKVKLLLQVCSVLPVVTLGHSVDRIVAFNYPIELGWFAIPLTVAWLVGCINALNLLDGMDGLASTVGLVTATMMTIIAISLGNYHVAVISMALAAALAGFLFYNLPPASIFLGDSGSMVIGLMVGVLAIQTGLKTSATLSIAVPAVIMSLPLFDTVLAVVRRKLTGRRLDVGDRKHIHHRLMDRGFNQWQTLCVIGCLCLITGSAATAATIFRNDALAWITALALMVLMIRLRLFGHHELALLKNAAARRLTQFANYLGTPGIGGGGTSPLDNLSVLPFGQAWDLLVDEARGRKIYRMNLTISDDTGHDRGYQWQDPSVESPTPTQCWISVTFMHRKTRLCELKATLLDSRRNKFQYAVGIDRLLIIFAEYFAEHIEDIPGLSLVGEDETDPATRKKAA